MSIRIKRIAGTIVFFLLLFSVLVYIQDLVTPNFDWPVHNRRSLKGIRSAFNEPSNSIDAVYFGTSQTFCSISPMNIYDMSGIRSYNLATTNQRVPVAYHLLKAFLRDQKPKVVVIDASGFFYTEDELQSNAKYEEMVDSLPISRFQDKIETMSEIATLMGKPEDKKYILSSIITLLRYHSNYLLKEEDYWEMYLKDLYQRKGYVATFDFVPVEDDVYRQVRALLDRDDPYASDDDALDKLKAALASNVPYLEKMQQMCNDIGAQLVFVKVPICMNTEHRGYWSANKHDMTQALSEKMGVKFLDMCYEDVGVDWYRDTNDGGAHVNYRGTQKVTARLLKWLQEDFGLSSEQNDQWDKSWSYQKDLFFEEMEYLKLELEDDLINYLQRVREGDFILLTVVSNTVGDYWSDEAQRAFEQATGSKLDLRDEENGAYLSISSHGEIIEERNDKSQCSLETTLENGLNCQLLSRQGKRTVNGFIKIDDTRYDLDLGAGIHFVVYDKKLGCVVDSVCFSASSEKIKAHQDVAYKDNMRHHVIEYAHSWMSKM